MAEVLGEDLMALRSKLKPIRRIRSRRPRQTATDLARHNSVSRSN